MTYRIAYVRFTKSGSLYPVNCERSDLDHGDLVVIRMKGVEPNLKLAAFDRLEFLNWNCKHTLICRRNEAIKGDRGGFFIKRNSTPRFLETFFDLEKEIRKLAWQPTGFSRHVYKWVYLKRFAETWAAIGLRKNGIDFQIYAEGWPGDLSHGPQTFPSSTHNLVRHHFYDSEKDLLEFAKQFASEAHKPLPELSKFFQPVGKRVRPKPVSEGDPMSEIRAALGGAMTDTERAAFG